MVPQSMLQQLQPDQPADAHLLKARLSNGVKRTSSDLSSGRSSGSSDAASGSSSYDDSDGGSSDMSSSSDDLSDNESLADRHKKRAARAAEHAAKRRRSSSDSGSKAGHRTKRRNLFPVIRKSQRCGTCHTCLNPQLKKACLTVREQMMREATRGTKHKAPTPKPAMPAARSSSSNPPADVDKYTDILLPFINSAGALADANAVQQFLKALPKFSTLFARTLPCTVLGLSSPAVLAEFMAAGGVDVLSIWMTEAIGEDTKDANHFLVEALTVLKTLPVNATFVKSNKVTKVIGALRKHDHNDVRMLANEIVKLWMKCIPAGTSKISSASQAPAPASAIQPLAKRLKIAGQDALSAGSATAAGSAGNGGAAAGHNSGFHMVSDNDLFRTTAALVKHRPLGRPSYNQAKKAAVQQLDSAEAGKLLGASPRQPQQQQQPSAVAKITPAAGNPAAAPPAIVSRQQQQQQQPVQQQQQEEEEPYVKLGLMACADEFLQVTLQVMQQAAALADASKPAAPVIAGSSNCDAASRTLGTHSAATQQRLPGVRKFGSAAGRPIPSVAAADGNSSGSTAAASGAGSSSIQALLGGAWAAGIAGAEVDHGSVAPAAKKAKTGPKKSVAWKSGRDLVAVRWFIKDDPPMQARKDAHLSEEQLHALSQHSHNTAFDQAARMEHFRERQVLEQQHKEAAEAAAHMRQLINAMQPQVEWQGPPPAAAGDPSWQVANGEDSTEARKDPQAVRHLLATYTQHNALPLEPLESYHLLQPPSALFNVPYHDQNVKIVPLNPNPTQAAAAAAAQPPSAEQQQPQQVVFAQPPQMHQQQPGHVQTFVLQPPQQQQPGLSGLQPQQLGGQLVLQPISQQQPQQQPVVSGPPPVQSIFAAPGAPQSSGPPSSNNSQAQLLQALQSLTQSGLLQQPQQQPLQPQQQQQPPQLQIQPMAQPPGASAGQPQIITVQGGMQILLPSGAALPPGLILAPPPQQQSQGPPLHMQYEQPPPVHHQQQHPVHPPPMTRPMARPMVRDGHGEEFNQHHRGPGRAGGRGGRGRGPGAAPDATWRRSNRECKFFGMPRGCSKGNACDFLHILPGQKFDVRDERRAG